MRKRRPVEIAGGAGVDLVPIMNLVVCLIPMVLLGASFTEVGVVDASPPRFGPCGGFCLSHGDAVSVTVALGADGRIDVQAGEERAVIPPRPGGGLDRAALYNHMAALKAAHPHSTIVYLTADARTPYRAIIHAMDTMRNRLERDTYADPAALGRARVHPDDPLLWPDVVLLAAR